MSVVYVGLGSNLGDRRAALEGATARICVLGPVRRSSWYRTAPVDMPGAPDFLNGVLELETTEPPRELLERLLGFEREMGRGSERLEGRSQKAEGRGGAEQEGTPRRSASRVIDIDMLLYGSEIVGEPGLEIPHPRMHERAFVLAPMCELAPGMMHPRTGRTMRELAAETDTSGVRLEVHRN